ncbi:MAG: hypothetical protein AAB354_15495 [candidate division KSB1 bacterium]
MLRLLLLTRLRYYRNFVRAHFDRITLLELGAIFLIFAFLALRSPADLGYSLNFLFAPEFSAKWASLWAALLPFFYLLAEAFAFITLRPASEAHLLATLPVAPAAILPYQLLRHFMKMVGLILVGTVLFMLGKHRVGEKVLAASTALTIMLALQLLAFAQAYRLRRSYRRLQERMPVWAWLSFECVILAVLFFAPELFRLPAQNHIVSFAKFALALTVLLGAWIWVRRVYDPTRLLETRRLLPWPKRSMQKSLSAPMSAKPEALALASARGRFHTLKKILPHGFIPAQLTRDLLFMRRQKPSLLLLCGGALALLTLASWAQTEAVHTYSAALFMQLLYSGALINSFMILFEHEAPAFSLLRALPITAAQFWWARWLLVFGLLVLPMLAPAFIIATRFGLTMPLLLFIIATCFILPAVFALLLCNTAFSMFPHARYAGILMNVFALLMLLFWFYMPLGTFILLGFTLTRVRKAQRHFQFLQMD